MFSREQYDALRRHAGLLDRTGRGRLLLRGADRRAYLQGILTNDIAALGAGDGCYAALLTPQGRMISDMRVSELGDAILLDLPGSTAEQVRQHLADFIFSEDVDVHDRKALSQLGLYGPAAPVVLAGALAGFAPEDAGRTRADLLEQAPVSSNLTVTVGDRPLVVVRSDDFGPGFELFIDAGDGDRLAAALRAGGALDVTAETAEVVRIEAGRPEFGVDMDEHTIPLEAGIEDRAISLTKGCYVGQEIVIRVLHRGQGRVAKKLVGLVAEGERTIARGARIEGSGREIGVVTSAARSPALQRAIALGYVHRDFVAPGTRVQIAADEGPLEATVVSLPFALPAAG
jgi:folate-binding protein YgfZ